jgi:hypothetical protein
MPKYIVNVPEIHISQMEIEAESPQEAIEKVAEGEGEELTVEYSHSCERRDELWTVRMEKEIHYKDGTITIPKSSKDSYYKDMAFTKGSKKAL